jgi:hypothetical protein
VRVVFHKTMQVHFRLPSVGEQVAQEVQLQYNYVGKKDSETAVPAPASGGYTISIG